MKLSNLMRVLTSEAVSDPTKIEARVRREIAARKEAHERQNAERRLTDEQRREKKEQKKEREEEKGLYCHVYRVKHLISGRHKFKVRRNALDHNLTGITVFHPSMALVVVEGSGKAVKAYKRLMTVRIDWTDPGVETNENESNDEEEKQEDANKVQPAGFKTLTTDTEDVDWASNSCELVFEGPIRERKWEGRGFRARACRRIRRRGRCWERSCKGSGIWRSARLRVRMMGSRRLLAMKQQSHSRRMGSSDQTECDGMCIVSLVS